MEQSSKILIIRLSALGDVAMTVPVIYSLARQYEGVRITVLTRPFFAKLFVNRPDNVELMNADYKGEHKGFGGTLRLLKEIKSRNFDCVADFHNVSRSWTIDCAMRLLGKRVAMVDKGRSERSKVLAGGAPQNSYINRYVDTLARLGFDVKLDFKSLYDEVPASASITLDQPAVGVAPFARYTNKSYPLDKMREVVALLASQGFKVYLFGARGDEAAKLEQWQSEIAGCTSLAGKFPIEEEIAIMSQLGVMVAMDSANQHLASLAGTKVVTIWGSTTPACGFRAYGQDESRSLVAGIECQPCTIAGSEHCRRGDLRCMNALSPQMIVDKIKSLLR